MNKFLCAIIIIVAPVALVACSPGGGGVSAGGGGGAGLPRVTEGSVFGNATPGAIVGVVCTEATVDIENGLKCPPPVSFLVGPDGKYNVKLHKAVGNYNVYASLGGHLSTTTNLTCGFSPSTGSQSGVLYDCNMPDMNLTQTVFTPPSVDGLSFSDNGTTAIRGAFANSHLLNGAVVPGAKTIRAGSYFIWGESFFYIDEKTGTAKTGFSRADLFYNPVQGTIDFSVSHLDEFGNLKNSGNRTEYGELRCGVLADVNHMGFSYYECSRFGVTFDKTRGVISFDTTPLYAHAPALPNFSNISNKSMISGSLTFQPF